MSQPSLTPERFAQVRAIFEAAVDRPPAERRAYAAGACAADADMLREVEKMLAAEDHTNTLLPRGGSPSSSSSTHEEGRFPAGTVLAGRYRILGLLGRGGMGEVYKAFDQILNQVVALKFLNPANVTESALGRFRNEVRIARQVSHPNVCRVYDLGMVEGLHFLSMEFIDGEDLSSLLRRIGRLPQDKAMEFTRKICAGLAAAHERGVLHRDLKPANIMIDGRGQPRITDFGLAGLQEEIPLSDLRSGTPAYMSPEQKAGKEVTTRSDIYALGLVLHEMFTGKQRRGDTQTNPSDFVKDLDPAVERVILRCLEEDPSRRPQTASRVAMSLPGADPIAAALAAGETPSPEMVAASQEKEGFRQRTAILCFLAILLLIVGCYFVDEHLGILSHLRFPLRPEVQADRARQLLAGLGYPDAPKTTAFGLDCCDLSHQKDLAKLTTKQRDIALTSYQPPMARYWYREHRAALGSGGIPYGRPDEFNPPNHEPGMIRVEMDPSGNLLQLEVQPWSQQAADQLPDWPSIFHAAGLKFSRFQPTAADAIPPMSTDAIHAWHGTYSGPWQHPFNVYAATWHNRLVWFEVQGAVTNLPNVADGNPVLVATLMLVGTLMCGLAFRQVHTRRADLRGAVVQTVITAGGALLVGFPYGAVLLFAVFCPALYLGTEHYARRYWPDALISWSRFVRGDYRNSLVASHLLAGLLAAVAFAAIIRVLEATVGFSPSARISLGIRAMGFGTPSLGGLAAGPAAALAFLALVILVRLLARRLWLADLVSVAVFLGILSATGFWLQGDWITLLVLTPATWLWIVLMRRFGYLSVIAAWTCYTLLSETPLVLNSWMFSRGLPVPLALVALGAWATWTVFSGRPRIEAEQ